MGARVCVGVALAILASAATLPGQPAGRPSGKKPAAPPTRWACSYTFEQQGLPAGISLRQDPKHGTWWVANTSDQPLVINAVYDATGKLAGGAKLVSSQVFFYFPSGIPQEGKQHLKGWQSLSKEITSWSISDLPPASKGFDGQDGKMTRDNPIPPPEPFALKVEYQGKPHQFKGTITYSFNEAYDAHYGLTVPKK